MEKPRKKVLLNPGKLQISSQARYMVGVLKEKVYHPQHILSQLPLIILCRKARDVCTWKIIWKNKNLSTVCLSGGSISSYSELPELHNDKHISVQNSEEMPGAKQTRPKCTKKLFI